MVSFFKIVSFVFLAVMISSVSVSADLIRVRRQSYWYSNRVVNNVVSDPLIGGPTSLGWAQVPHVYSPMFSPVFGK